MMVEICYPRTMKNIIALCVMIVLVGSLSSCNLVALFKCTPGYVRSDFSALQAQVRQNKTLWIGKGIKSYEYTSQSLSYGSPVPLRVTVKAGVVTQAKAIPDPQRPNQFAYIPSDLQTLTTETRFTELERSMTSPGDCDTAKLEFDATYGFPKSAAFSDQTNGLADGFGGFTITDFTVTP
jgi:Family of unknown function (DUF6174)